MREVGEKLVLELRSFFRLRTSRALLKITISEPALCRTAATIGLKYPNDASDNPPMMKHTPNKKFWLMPARVLRESFTRNGRAGLLWPRDSKGARLKNVH